MRKWRFPGVLVCLAAASLTYDSGLPFGLELSGRPFKDGDLLGYTYAWEQATHYRRPPELVDKDYCPAARIE